MRAIIQYATKLLHQLPEEYVFHNYSHTLQVAKMAREIGAYENISSSDMYVLLVACWLHDLGYAFSDENHEEASIQIAIDFLSQEGFSKHKIRKISSLIRATKMPHHPHSLLEKIICDADLAYLGSRNFPEQSLLLKREREYVTGQFIPEIQWHEQSRELLANHQFFTRYGQRFLFPQQHQNMKLLETGVPCK
ncbi:MAG: HD domain-containing protein [Bacteroidetes bacterium]|nr:MAG: HD domain-containing protein [Bacteroidota bacterium]